MKPKPITFKLESDLHNKAKIQAIQKGITLAELLNELIKSGLENDSTKILG